MTDIKIEKRPVRIKNAPRVCTIEGCGDKHIARGFCDRHYRHWLIANPDKTQGVIIPAIIMRLLPATQQVLIEKTGWNSITIKNALARMRADEAIHVGDHQPPTKVGSRFMPIYHAGPGEDAVVTKKDRLLQKRKSAVVGHHRRRMKSAMTEIPKANAWAAALFIRPDKAYQNNPAKVLAKGTKNGA